MGFDRKNSIFLHPHGKRKLALELHLSLLIFESSRAIFLHFFQEKPSFWAIFSDYWPIWACKSCSKIALTQINDLSISKSTQKVRKSFNFREWPKGFCQPIFNAKPCLFWMLIRLAKILIFETLLCAKCSKCSTFTTSLQDFVKSVSFRTGNT